MDRDLYEQLAEKAKVEVHRCTSFGHRIPEHMKEAVREYVISGRPCGEFLYAVICNDLKEACLRADDLNIHALPAYVMFFYNVPMGCSGSAEAYSEWIEKGGLAGLVEE